MSLLAEAGHAGRSANHPLRTFQQLRTNSGECLHSNCRDAAWNDRHGRKPAVEGASVLHPVCTAIKRSSRHGRCEPAANGRFGSIECQVHPLPRLAIRRYICRFLAVANFGPPANMYSQARQTTFSCAEISRRVPPRTRLIVAATLAECSAETSKKPEPNPPIADPNLAFRLLLSG